MWYAIGLGSFKAWVQRVASVCLKLRKSESYAYSIRYTFLELAVFSVILANDEVCRADVKIQSQFVMALT